MTRPLDTRARRRRLAGALVCTVLLVPLAGCGAREGIPRDDAKDIEGALNDVEEQFGDGDCTALTSTGMAELQASVDTLPRKVDEEIRTVLANSVEELEGLASECVEAPEPEPVTTTTPTPSTTTAPLTTETEETKTEPVTTETEEEPPVEPEVPEEKPGKEPKIKPPKGEFPDAPTQFDEEGDG
ncbi:MAG: hypothetical protein H0U42_04295 [Thermoleophilaceae bacterium]|nr:hypothetical protein [Thermoleophilaceae bacterium]